MHNLFLTFLLKNKQKTIKSILLRFAQPFLNAQPFVHNLYYQKSKKAKNRAGRKAASNGLVKHFKDLVKKGK